MAPTQVYPGYNHARLPGKVPSQVPAPLFVDPHEGGGQLAELFVVDGRLVCDRNAPPQLTSLPVG